MAEKIYFQWQNDILRKTIYPVRDMKLRHFLLYYKEVDLWAEFRDKKVEDLPDEKREYEDAQKKVIADAFNHETSLRDYFIKHLPDTDLEAGNDEIVGLKKLLLGLHDAFGQYFEDYKKEKNERARDRKEKIFVAMRVAEWERYRKEMKQKIAKKKSLLSDPKATNRDLKTRDLAILEETVLPRMEAELKKLKEFVAAQNRLEKRKAEFAEREAENVKERDAILLELEPLRKLIDSAEAARKRLNRVISLLTNPPGIDDLLGYFSKVDIYEKIRSHLTQGKVPAHDRVIDVIVDTVRDTISDSDDSFHKDLIQLVEQWKERGMKDPAWTLQWIKNQSARFQEAQKKLVKVILALEAGVKSMSTVEEKANRLAVINILSDAAMRDMLDGELEKLDDLQAVIDYSQKDKHTLDGLLSKARSDLEKTRNEITKNRLEVCTWEEKLEPIEFALHIVRDKYLAEYIPDHPIRIKEDIVPFLAEQYNAKLEKMDHDQLLHEVFKRFWNEPERFPLWLQYMVVHFSGMRYASAHGSWADPRDMLLNLKTLDIQEELKSDNTDDNELMTACEGRISIYDPLPQATGDSNGSLPEYARAAAADATFRSRVKDYYVAGLNSERPDRRRKVFFDLRVDEENYEIRAMKTEDVLDELKLYKNKLPEWMWKEIVKLTDLRLTEVNDENWETLTAEEQAERLSNADRQMGKYRDIMNKWKESNLTGWRQEHDRSNRLIVTRAVCNEVAEHIQHLRGLEGAAGLTQKPLWYMDEEETYYETYKTAKPGPHPFFVRAKQRNHFEVGASILWLRFVRDMPNEWRVARPLATREGDGLIDDKYLGRSMDSGGWVYYQSEVPIRRTRVPVAKKGSKGASKENQWLRWMHEATVAAVEETAEGTVVLTFETALPYEDPSLSTIGLFKRYVHDLTFDGGEDAYNPAFVGFVPEDVLPASDLEDMLDWNHILLEKVVSAKQLEDYRKKYIRNRKPTRPVIEVINRVDGGTNTVALPEPVIAKKNLKDFVDWTDGLAAPPKSKLYKVKKWGDVRPGERDVDVVGTTNFQAVGLFNRETGYGAVSNFIYVLRDDIENLIRMQFKEKDNGIPVEKKMNWLCKYRGTVYMFDSDKDSWMHSSQIRWGTVALGGNLVQVEDFEEIQIKAAGKKKEVKLMARLAGFRKSDWARPLDELLAEGLVHRCFCAYKGNGFGDTPKGIVYSPFFSLLDWDFGGQKKPLALYLPAEDLEKPKPKLP